MIGDTNRGVASDGFSSVIDAGNACDGGGAATSGGNRLRDLRRAVRPDTVRDGKTARPCRRRSEGSPSSSTSSVWTFPPILSRLSRSTTSRCPSSSHATDTPAMPPPMIATVRRGGAAYASTGEPAVAAIVLHIAARQVASHGNLLGELSATSSRALSSRPERPAAARVEARPTDGGQEHDASGNLRKGPLFYKVRIKPRTGFFKPSPSSRMPGAPCAAPRPRATFRA